MAKQEVEQIQGRSCGNCSLCCTVLSVQELSKPTNTRCQHHKRRGCEIYPDRPFSCRAFSCAWLLGKIESHYRPSRVNAVVHATTLRTKNGNTELKVMKVSADNTKKLHRSVTALLQSASMRVLCILEYQNNVQFWQLGICVFKAPLNQPVHFDVNHEGRLTDIGKADPDGEVMTEHPRWVDTRFTGNTKTIEEIL